MIDAKMQEELKKKLIKEKNRLEGILAKTEIGKEKADREYETTFPEVDRDEEANADEIDMYENNLASDESMKAELEKIDKSLAAMDNGTYGLCANCQKEIPIERLNVYPQADTCLDCEEK